MQAIGGRVDEHLVADAAGAIGDVAEVHRIDGCGGELHFSGVIGDAIVVLRLFPIGREVSRIHNDDVVSGRQAGEPIIA